MTPDDLRAENARLRARVEHLERQLGAAATPPPPDDPPWPPPDYLAAAGPALNGDGVWCQTYRRGAAGGLPARLVSGYGGDAPQAAREALRRAWADYRHVTRPDADRLRAYLKEAAAVGRFYDRDLVDVVAILARAALRPLPPDPGDA